MFSVPQKLALKKPKQKAKGEDEDGVSIISTQSLIQNGSK